MTSLTAPFWNAEPVLVTGRNGFECSWLTLWLAWFRAGITGLALPPSTTPALFTRADIGLPCTSRCCDLRDTGVFNRVFATARPEIIFHPAAQPLVC
jgi:CDP-glucose 4,6-dehydratase